MRLESLFVVNICEHLEERTAQDCGFRARELFELQHSCRYQQAEHGRIFVVLSGNHFGYMTTGVTMTLVDSAYPINLPSQIQFDDLDTQSDHFGEFCFV